jgi:uncharacterized protein (DUF2252 family)
MPTHTPPEERAEAGRAARRRAPRSSHADWQPAADRKDPVDILTAQDHDRLQFLVPVRHGRMSESSFAFYRGSAAIMAADLAQTPNSGIEAQLCGDAHLSNFGSYASPERTQVFDVNDFDETLPGPWEWDVKRLAASFVLAARDNGYASEGQGAAEFAVSAYQQAMTKFAGTGALEVWYDHLALREIYDVVPSKKDRKKIAKNARKSRARTSSQALGKLTEEVDGRLRIRQQRPVLIPLRDMAANSELREVERLTRASFHRYSESLNTDRQALLSRFEFIDMGLKVVGVGSVGTRCFVVLLKGPNIQEPLVLQIKEAGRSVLEDHLPASRYRHHGKRVVSGQRLMQGTSDIFLGWSTASTGVHYYWRQFRDMKGSADIEKMDASRLRNYAYLCGWTLAHAHARGGDPVAIAAYLGKSSTFAEALGEFAVQYADQNDKDYATFLQAIKDGRIQAEED